MITDGNHRNPMLRECVYKALRSLTSLLSILISIAFTQGKYYLPISLTKRIILSNMLAKLAALLAFAGVSSVQAQLVYECDSYTEPNYDSCK